MLQREIDHVDCRHCQGTGMMTLRPARKGRRDLGAVICACAAGRVIAVGLPSQRREIVRYG